MDERSWHSGRIFEAWEQIHSALNEAMEALPLETLAFLAERASDRIIRDAAADALNEDMDAVNAEKLRRLFHKEADEMGNADSLRLCDRIAARRVDRSALGGHRHRRSRALCEQGLR